MGSIKDEKNETQKLENSLTVTGIIIGIISLAAIITADPQLTYPSTLRIIAAITILLAIILKLRVLTPR